MKIQLPKYLYHSAESAKNTPLEHRTSEEQTSPNKTLDKESDEGIGKDPLSKQYPFQDDTFGQDIVKHRVGQIEAQEIVRKGEALPHPIPQEYEGVDFNNPEHPLSQASFQEGLEQALEKAGISQEKIPGLKDFMEGAGGNFWLTFLNTPFEALGGYIKGTQIDKSIGNSYLVTSVNDPAYGSGEVFGKILAGFASGELGREYYNQFPSNMQKVFQDIFTPKSQSGKNGDTVASVWPPEPHSHPGIQ